MLDGFYCEFFGHDFVVFETVRPEDLEFTKAIRDVETMQFGLSFSSKQVDPSTGEYTTDDAVWRDVPTNEDFVKADKHFYTIFFMDSDVRTDIMGGKIKQSGGSRAEQSWKLGGQDWLGYLGERQLPYNPHEPEATWSAINVFGPTISLTQPPPGMSYSVAGRDVGRIVKDVVSHIYDVAHGSPFIESSFIPDLGYTIDQYSLSLGDTSTILSIISGLSEYWPGFDYRVSTNRELVLWSPYRFGDPDTTADDGPTGGNITLAIGDDFDVQPLDVRYTNTGPQATHILGRGSGSGTTQNTIVKPLGASDIQTGYGRMDGATDFGDQAKSQNVVDMRTRRQFIFGAQEVHEIEVDLDTSVIPNFWSTIRPGLAVWVREDLQAHKIDSAQRIVNMNCKISNQQDGTVTLGLNQIYNTSSHYGVEEG